MLSKAFFAFVVAGGLMGAADAGQIMISDIGGGITLNSGPMGPSVFGNDQSVWTHASLASAHSLLNASGVETNGKITIVAADTTHGLAMMALFDQDTVGRTPIAMGNVELVTVAHGDNLAYLNSGANNVIISPNGPTSRTAMGTVQWNSNGGGNGFAWAALEVGNTMTFRFNKVPDMPLGLDDPNTFQFASWNGSSWSVIPLAPGEKSFTATDDYGFSAQVESITVVPLPSGSLLAGASLVGLAGLRRRR